MQQRCAGRIARAAGRVLAAEVSLSLLLAQVPVISDVAVDGVGHSSARLTWNASGCFVTAERIRYGLTTSYEAGPGGGIQGGGNVPQGNHYQLALSGLQPNTTYHVCAQSSCDGGATWPSCTDTVFTTLPQPDPHPAFPVPPETFDASYPDTTGYPVVTAAADCSDLQSLINSASAAQAAHGTVIQVPAGVVCTGSYVIPRDSSARAYSQQSVSTSANSITISAHGFAEGQPVIVTALHCNGGFCGSTPTPLVRGEVYYVRNPGVNDFQLAQTAGGSPLALSDPGGPGGGFVAPWPPSNSNWIVIRTATPDSQFSPREVRIHGADWAPKMPSFVNPGGAWDESHFQFWFGEMSHHVYLSGLEITHSDASALAQTTNDPKPTMGFIVQWPDNAYITWDRCYIHGRGAPNRLYRPFVWWAGHYVAIRNSDMPLWTYPRSSLPYRTQDPYAFKTSFANQTVKLAPGSVKLLSGRICSAAQPVYFSASGTTGNTSTASLEIALDCSPQLILPEGAGASCAGSASDGSADHPCAVITRANPGWTRDPNGGYQNFQLAQFSVSSGVWSAPVDSLGQGSLYATEGTQGVIAGPGRGPFLLENNFSSGAGLLWHFDDSYAAPQNKSFVLRRNTFETPGYAQFGGASSDGFEYSIRNGPEWKHGSQILVTGNIFDGGQAGISSTGCALTLTGRAAQWVSDAEIANNTFQNVSCGIQIIGGIPYSDPVNGTKSQPFQHGWIHNNLFNRVDGATYFDPAARQAGTGYPFLLGYGIEDLIIDHNTVFDVRGYDSVMFHVVQAPIEGMRVTNNIFTFNNDNGAFGLSIEGTQENFPTCNANAKAAMDCFFLQGAGNPSYTFANNLLAPLYNTSDLSGNMNPGAVSARYTNLNVFVPQDATPAARIKSIGFVDAQNGMFRLRPDSPYAAGGTRAATDGQALGADIETLEVVQGHVPSVSVSPGANHTAMVTFPAPDSFGCPVDYSTDPQFSVFSRVANPGGDRAQSVLLENLQGGATYYVRLMCAVEQLTTSFVAP